MPIYEYEPTRHDCLICSGRIEVLQGVGEELLTHCPTCGLDIKRVVSRASIAVSKSVDADKAAKKGFTTFRRSEAGVYEKIAGEGPAGFVGDQPAKKRTKVVELDP